MPEQTSAAGSRPAAPDTPTPAAGAVVRLGDRDVRIERITGLKLSRALAVVRALGKAIPQLVHQYGTFRSEYARTHSLELDRAAALRRYGPEPIIGPDGDLVVDEHGQPRMLPGELDHLTDADWQAAGNVLRLPASPSTAESVAAMLPEALEVAEEHVYRLCALLTIPNVDVARYWRTGELKERLDERVDELLAEAYADELLELAVVCGEVLDEQFRRKTSELGGRLGNALRLFGLDPTKLPNSPTTSPTATSTEQPSTSRPTSSTDSPASTDGPPTPSSTPPPTYSTPSGDEPGATPNGSTTTPATTAAAA